MRFARLPDRIASMECFNRDQVRSRMNNLTGSCKEVRLNSHRGKFKITNMADDQVDLPEDIPGARCIEEEIEKILATGCDKLKYA